MGEDSRCSHLLFQKAHSVMRDNNLIIIMAPVELMNGIKTRELR